MPRPSSLQAAAPSHSSPRRASACAATASWDDFEVDTIVSPPPSMREVEEDFDSDALTRFFSLREAALPRTRELASPAAPARPRSATAPLPPPAPARRTQPRVALQVPARAVRQQLLAAVAPVPVAAAPVTRPAPAAAAARTQRPVAAAPAARPPRPVAAAPAPATALVAKPACALAAKPAVALASMPALAPVPAPALARALAPVAARVVAPAAAKATDKDRILRFVWAERLVHWSFAVPFLVCFVTALVLVLVYNSRPGLAHRDIVAVVHRVAAIALVALPLLALLIGVRHWRFFLENMKEGWLWRLREVKWLFLMPLAAISKRVKLPEEGKFNAAEKVNFMWTTVAIPLFAFTGLVIWSRGPYNILSWIAHLAIAGISLPLVCGHMFMALINRASRKGLSGMVSGYVERAWARHHYRGWYKEKFAAEDPSCLEAHEEPTDEADDAVWSDVVEGCVPVPVVFRNSSSFA